MQTNAEQIIESIQSLPVPEREKVFHWVDEERKPQRAAENWDERTNKFKDALLWIDENRGEYLGKWVCLDGGRLVASGDDAKAVFEEARAKGIEIPFIEQVREVESAPFWGGWD